MGLAAGKKAEEHLLGSGTRMALVGMGSRKSLENRQASYVKKACLEQNNEAAERCKRTRAMTSGGLGKPPAQPPPGSCRWENHLREAQQSTGGGQGVELLSKSCSCEDALKTPGHGSSAGKCVGKVSSAGVHHGLSTFGKVLRSPRAVSLPAHSAGRPIERERLFRTDWLTWKLQISLSPASEYNLVFS